jgi:protein TonB
VIPLGGEAGVGGDSLRRQIIEKSLSFTQAADRLWSTFRLDPGRRRQLGKYVQAVPGTALELPPIEYAGVRLTATPVRFTGQTATYRIQFRQGDKSLVDSTVTVARGGRAVVGGTNGAAAPYVFVLIEPDPPGHASPEDIRSQKALGITQPEIIEKVAPKYPEEAKKDKIQGIVILELVIEADGRVSDIRALQDPDSRLTAAAVEAVRQWRFSPAKGKDGNPLRVLSSVTLNFQLK